jgi:hypothetical protein
METAATKPANATVQRCCEAFNRAYHAEFAKTQSHYSAGDAARDAFRDAMPFLTGPEIVNDFIACVSQGILLRAIEPMDASKLLYAAQVILSAQRRKPTENKPAQTKTQPTTAPTIQPSVQPQPAPSTPAPPTIAPAIAPADTSRADASQPAQTAA